MSVRNQAPNKNVVKALQLQEQGKVAEAAKLFRRVLATAPADWMALFSLGRILVSEGNLAEAIRLLDRLVLVQPAYAPGFQIRGVALERLGRYQEAARSMEKGLEIEPNDVDALNRLGVLLDRMGQVNDAILALRRALLLAPADEMSMVNLGKMLFFSRRYKDAGVVLQQLVDISPGYRYALGMLAFNRLHEAQWAGLETTIDRITADIRAGKPACLSLAFMSMSDSAMDQLHCARMYTGNFHPRAHRAYWNGELYQHQRIRIAYISPDLRDHPVGRLMAGVIERHDRSRFEVIGVSLGRDDGSAMRERFRTSFDSFHDAEQMAMPELCKLIRSLEVDIAVDLTGFTQDNRTDLYAHRVAPVQVNYLGYPGTMGADYMDYIIGDRCVIPPHMTDCYDEKIAYLPDAYLPTELLQIPTSRTPSRAEAGLPESGFVFCSFNHIFKINPKIFRVWMQLLSAVPGSVLWLSKPGPDAIDNLRQAAMRDGIDPQRLVFAERVPLVEDHLSRYRLADLFLDTTPYNAHTTAADALMLGLPVLTCAGNTFASRVASSLLHAIGLPELITESLDDYQARAVALASQPEQLAEIKARLMANLSKYPLFDTQRYCGHLEAAFETMHARIQNGQVATGFAVESMGP